MNIAMYMITQKKFFTIQINNEDILAHTSNTFCVSFFSYHFSVFLQGYKRYSAYIFGF